MSGSHRGNQVDDQPVKLGRFGPLTSSLEQTFTKEESLIRALLNEFSKQEQVEQDRHARGTPIAQDKSKTFESVQCSMFVASPSDEDLPIVEIVTPWPGALIAEIEASVDGGNFVMRARDEAPLVVANPCMVPARWVSIKEVDDLTGRAAIRFVPYV